MAQSRVPEPGVEIPLKKALGSKSIPRFFFTDLRFLLEKPKVWPDSKGSFRLDDGVEITGVAEEKTGGDQRRITECRRLQATIEIIGRDRAKAQRPIKCRRCLCEVEAQAEKAETANRVEEVFNSCIIQKEFFCFVHFKWLNVFASCARQINHHGWAMLCDRQQQLCTIPTKTVRLWRTCGCSISFYLIQSAIDHIWNTK